MRVGYVSSIYPRATDTFVQREVENLRALGVEVVTFSVRRPGDEHLTGPEQVRESASTTYLLPFRPGRVIRSHLRMLRAPGRYLRTLRLAAATKAPGIRDSVYQAVYFLEAGILAAEIRKQGVEHVHDQFAAASGNVTMMAAEMAGVGFSVTLHGPDIFFEPDRWHIADKVRRAKFVSCISNFARAQALVFAPECIDKMHVVHCGVPPAEYVPTPHEPAAVPELVFVGRFDPVKGVGVLMQAAGELASSGRSFRITLVGGGDGRDVVERQVAELGLTDRVHFAGRRSRAEVRQHLADASIFVLPSFAEGVPVVLMEAMASGVPVIATNVGGVSELIEHQRSGLLVAPSDAAALRDAIASLLDDPAFADRLAANGRAWVEKEFDSAIEAAKLRDHFTRAIND